MKKCLSILLTFIILFSCTIAQSDTMTIDLSTMTIEELDDLAKKVNDEKKKATETASDVKKLLESDFMKAVEAINPEGTTFSYPFFGLSVVHRRSYYCVCGTVGCHFPDRTNKDLWDATIIYWLDEDNALHRAAFYSRDEVYFVDEYALSHVVKYAEQIALENLARHNILVDEVSSRSMPNITDQPATATPEPTSTPSPKNTATPKPTSTPTPKNTDTPEPTSTPAPQITDIPEFTPSETTDEILVSRAGFAFGTNSTNNSTVKKTATPKKTSTPKPTVKKTATPKPTVKKTATPKPTAKKTATPRKTATPKPRGNVGSYVINTNSGIFHKPTCGSVKQMKEKNKWYYTGTRQEIINMGYTPCKKCKP